MFFRNRNFDYYTYLLVLMTPEKSLVGNSNLTIYRNKLNHFLITGTHHDLNNF